MAVQDRLLEGVDEARPQAQEPDHCDLPAATSRPVSQAATDTGYRVAIDDMSCASCVARVEKAILSVDGVHGASVNLVEGAAYVDGGDPLQVVNAIVDQGYPAQLPHVDAAASVTLAFLPKPGAADKQRIDSVIETIDTASGLSWTDENSATLTLNSHPADYLLAL